MLTFSVMIIFTGFKTTDNLEKCLNDKSSIIFKNLSFTDIDECQAGSHDCHDNATCQNNQGNHNCTCNKGYQGNGTHCDGEFDFVRLRVIFRIRLNKIEYWHFH